MLQKRQNKNYQWETGFYLDHCRKSGKYVDIMYNYQIITDSGLGLLLDNIKILSSEQCWKQKIAVDIGVISK